VVWVGQGRLGERDGRLALFLADSVPYLVPPPPEPPAGPLHALIREHLEQHGASFFGEIQAAACGGLAEPVVEALWDLAWAGAITNDTPSALRAFLAVRAPRAERRPRVSGFRSRRQVPAAAVGRWSMLALPRGAPSPTERLKALAEQLLRRHGVVTRDAVAFEAVPGGFPAVYPVLRALEEAGRIRRGYFVAGQGGLQFAQPGALERLRAKRDADPETPQAVVLAAADPANPYGAALPWPRLAEPLVDDAAARPAARLARAAGTHVVLVDGAIVAVLSARARQVVPLLPAEEPARARVAAAAARALARWCEATGRPALGWAVEEGPSLAEGPLAPFLAEAGFVRSGPGFRLAASPQGPGEENADYNPLRRRTPWWPGHSRRHGRSWHFPPQSRARPAPTSHTPCSRAPSGSSSPAATRAADRAREPSRGGCHHRLPMPDAGLPRARHAPCHRERDRSS
jgi:ATP-dependent Lhr-like helicase